MSAQQDQAAFTLLSFARFMPEQPGDSPFTLSSEQQLSVQFRTLKPKERPNEQKQSNRQKQQPGNPLV